MFRNYVNFVKQLAMLMMMLYTSNILYNFVNNDYEHLLYGCGSLTASIILYLLTAWLEWSCIGAVWLIDYLIISNNSLGSHLYNIETQCYTKDARVTYSSDRVITYSGYSIAKYQKWYKPFRK
jgi:hypothetical protein